MTPASVNDATAIKVMLLMVLHRTQHPAFNQEEPCPGHATYDLAQLHDGACQATIDAAHVLPCRL